MQDFMALTRHAVNLVEFETGCTIQPDANSAARKPLKDTIT